MLHVSVNARQNQEEEGGGKEVHPPVAGIQPEVDDQEVDDCSNECWNQCILHVLLPPSRLTKSILTYFMSFVKYLLQIF